MIVTELKIKGVLAFELEPIEDERGCFARVWCKRELEPHGMPEFVQCNMSTSNRAGTLRGLHYQISPYQEAKLVQCIRGTIYDVVVDLRPTSPTYGRWLGTELTEEKRKLLYVPEGCAHGYQAQMDHAVLLYFVSQFYRPESERGLRWNDPRLGIRWPIKDPIISAKDNCWPDFYHVDASSVEVQRQTFPE